MKRTRSSRPILLVGIAIVLLALGAIPLVAGRLFQGDPVFVGAGDIAACDSNGDEATAALLDNIPGTVFAAGDLAYETATMAEFNNCYNPTWGRFKSRTRPVPGNHEYITGEGSPYFTYFGEAAGDPSKGYYSYDLGSWHIIALNSEIDVKAGSTQEQWLRADLAAHPANCTLAYWHQARFSSGAWGNNATYQPLWQALYEAGAEIVINGHDHDYERFAPQTPVGIADAGFGIREFVVGTGGKSHIAFGQIRANSEVRNGDTYGVLKLTLHDKGYDWQFIPEAGKTFADSGSGVCHGTPPAKQVTTVTVAADSFSRTVADNWGSAEIGGAYALAGNPKNFDVNGSTGVIALTAPNTAASAYLTGVSALNTDASFRLKVDKPGVAGGHMAYAVARRVSEGNAYLGRIRWASDGRVLLQVVRESGGTQTLLGSETKVPGVTRTDNVELWVRVNVVGTNPTTLLMKGWVDGQPEPSDWTNSVTDTTPILQAPGAVGLRAYLAGSATNPPVLFSFNDFRVTSAAGAP